MSREEPFFTEEGEKLIPVDFNFDDLIPRFGDRVKDTLHLKYPLMDSDMNSYMERANNHDPKCICVKMDEVKQIDFSKNQEEREEVFTYGLGGCIATVLVVEMKDGTEKVILAHNSPLTTQMGGITIRELGADIKAEDVKKTKIFILAPGEYEKNSEGKWELKIEKQSEIHIRILETSAQIVAGVKTESERIAYSTNIFYNQKNQGVFRVVKEKNGKLKYIFENNLPREIFD